MADAAILTPVNEGELADLLAAAGWQAVGWRNLAGGIVALHRGWNA